MATNGVGIASGTLAATVAAGPAPVSTTTTAAAALTTVFTPPARCEALPWTYNIFTDTQTAYMWKSLAQDNPDCYPFSMVAFDGTYSPGVCPSGRTTAMATIVGDHTSALCCPSSYIYFFGDCASLIPTPLDALFIDKTTSYTSSTTGTAMASGVIVLYRDSDTSLFPRDYTLVPISSSYDMVVIGAPFPTGSQASGNLSASLSASLSSTAGTGFDSGSNSPKSGGLSNGAKIGIGIGVPLIVVIVGFIVFLWLRRRGRSRKPSYRYISPKSGTHETHGNPINELDPSAEKLRNELPATDARRHKPVPTVVEVEAGGKRHATSPSELETTRHQPGQGETIRRRPLPEQAPTGRALSSAPTLVSTANAPWVVMDQDSNSPVEHTSASESPQPQHDNSEADVVEIAPTKESPTPAQQHVEEEDVELRWLSKEEARIQARKAEILAKKTAS